MRTNQQLDLVPSRPPRRLSNLTKRAFCAPRPPDLSLSPSRLPRPETNVRMQFRVAAPHVPSFSPEKPSSPVYSPLHFHRDHVNYSYCGTGGCRHQRTKTTVANAKFELRNLFAEGEESPKLPALVLGSRQRLARIPPDNSEGLERTKRFSKGRVAAGISRTIIEDESLGEAEGDRTLADTSHMLAPRRCQKLTALERRHGSTSLGEGSVDTESPKTVEKTPLHISLLSAHRHPLDPLPARSDEPSKEDGMTFTFSRLGSAAQVFSDGLVGSEEKGLEESGSGQVPQVSSALS